MIRDTIMNYNDESRLAELLTLVMCAKYLQVKNSVKVVHVFVS